MPLSLSETLPLRDTSVWGEYREAKIIPQVYGVATLSPIKYDRAGYKFVIGEGTIKELVAVYRNDESYTNARLLREVDSTGNPISVLELGDRLPDNTSLAVTVKGKLSSITGNYIENPAEVIADIYLMLGRPAPAWLSDLAVECYRRGYTIGGVLDSKVTGRAAISEILSSIGVEFNTEGYTFIGEEPTAYLNFTNKDDSFDSLSTDKTFATRRIQVKYKYDWAKGQPSESIFLASGSVVENDELLEYDAPWLSSARQAQAIGAAILNTVNRINYKGTVTSKKLISLGTLVNVSNRYWPVEQVKLIGLSVNSLDGIYRYDVIAQTGQAQRVVTTGFTKAVAKAVISSVTVNYEGGTLTVIVRDDTGVLLKNAEVTLDGAETRITDVNGSVAFTTVEGSHTLLIRAAGFNDMELGITV